MNYTIPLGEIVASQKGSKPAFLKKKPFPSSVPYLDIGALENANVKEYTFKELGTVADENDLLVVWDGSRSGLALKGKYGVIGSTLMKLIPLGFEKEYLYYFVKSNFDYINLNKIGSGIPHVDPNLIFSLEVPFTTLSEQKKIILQLKSKLDLNSKLFQQQKEALNSILKSTKVDFYIDEDVLRTIQNFKKAVINAAVTGQLTSQWRSQNNCDSIKSIYEKIQLEKDAYYQLAVEKATKEGLRPPKNEKNNKKSQNVDEIINDIPKSWSIFRLEDISFLVTDGTHHKPKYIKKGVKFLSVKNVRPFLIKDEDIKYISIEEHTRLIRRCKPEKGDILYTKIGATFGYAAMVRQDYQFSIFVSLALIKPVRKFIDGEFLELMMNSELVFNQARQRITGVANPDLHLIEIRDFKIPLTNIEEQQEVVRLVKPLLEIAETIETNYQQSLKDYANLEKAIIREAFEKVGLENDKDYFEYLENLPNFKQQVDKSLKEIRKIQANFRKTNFMQNTISNISQEIKNIIIEKYNVDEITSELKIEIREFVESLIPDMDYDDFSQAFQILTQDKLRSDDLEPFLLSGKKEGKLHHFVNKAYETPIS